MRIAYLPCMLAATLLVACGGDRSEPVSQAPDASSSPAASPAPAGTWSDAGLAALEAYERTARELAAGIDARRDVDILVATGEVLMAEGMILMPEFTSRHPHCAAYLEAASAVRKTWRELDHDTIERDYHEDGALQRPDNAAACYHVKDLVVHPATALVLLTQVEPDFDAARREIDEVLAHMVVVRMH